MRRTKLRMAPILAILTLVLPGYSQNKAPDADSKSTLQANAAPKPETEKFYFHSWGKGEYKVCQTYSGVPNVVLCDSDDDIDWKSSFMNLLAGNSREGKTEEQSYRLALNFASEHGKSFLTRFSEDPWPKPQTGFKLSVWNCSKDKNNTISCELGGRTTKTTTAE
ncbi:MAG: hypothetical protein ABSA96_21660 [Candidatus Acidiferrales bacterium]